MTLPSDVRYAILRNNIVVPLVPVDQLPFQLQGLPRQLEPSQYDDQGWKVIGETQQPALMLPLRVSVDVRPENLVPTVKSKYLSPDHNARKDLAMTTRALQPLRSDSPALHIFMERNPQEFRPGLQTERPRRPAEVPTDLSAASMSCSVNRVTKTPGVEPDSSKKEYCTHWIRHNSCDFMQQGCRYKHEMPDREKLKELGFPHVPMWYRDKMAISAGSSSWIRPRNTKSCDERQLSTEPLASRSFHPLAMAERPSCSLNSERPKQSGHGLSVEPSHIPNLIDLDDLSVKTTSLVGLGALRSATAMPHDASITITQPLDQLTNTFASSLREATGEPIDRAENANLITTQRAMSSIQNSSITNVSSTSRSSQVPQTTRVDKTHRLEDSVGLALEPLRKAEEKNNKKPKSHGRRLRSPQPKLAEGLVSIAAQSGLRKSQHVTEGKIKRITRQNKDAKAAVLHENADLQSQIVLHQRTAREQEKSVKVVRHAEMHPCGAPLLQPTVIR